MNEADLMNEIREKFSLYYSINSNDCWIWQRSKSGNGYGMSKYKNKAIRAHRLSYMLFKGEIPEKMLICHTCDVRDCVNPSHLFMGTAKDNIYDAIKKGRMWFCGKVKKVEKVKRKKRKKIIKRKRIKRFPMTKTTPEDLRKRLHEYYEATLDDDSEQPLWDRIGISHYTYLKFMNGSGLPHLKTMIKIKRFLEANKRKVQA